MSLEESTLVQRQLISSTQITFSTAQTSLSLGQRIVATAIVFLGVGSVVSDVVIKIARIELKKKVEDDTDGRKVVYHYTDKASATGIAGTGLMIASNKYKGYSGTFPSGAYASTIEPWNVLFTQSSLSGHFYGGDTKKDVSWFVALDSDGFISTFNQGYSDFRYKPGNGGEDVDVLPLAFGPNLMNQ